MSLMSAQITKAIKVAKANLGDLVLSASLKRVTGQSYVDGTYTPIETSTPVDLVVDKFSYNEMQSGEFKETDMKVSVFNNDAGDLSITTDDRIVLDSIQYSVYKVDPARVGPVIPLFEVVLRR